MMQVMASPFRRNKKQRKYYRKSAKAWTKAADELAAESIRPEIEAVCRKIADFDTKMSLAKRRKKKPRDSKQTLLAINDVTR
jgi:hypothetical protein